MTGLESATNLKGLYLEGNYISDVSPLRNLTDLRHLRLDHNNISDVSPLRNLTKLRDLYLSSNNISDVSPLRNLTKLRNLSLDHNNISDVSPLRNLTNLTYLGLDHNNISDVSPLRNLTNLTYLYLDHNNISDVSPLQDLTKLTRPYLRHNNISDVSPLRNLTNLTFLHLDHNNISDVSPLRNLTNLRHLYLYFNNISDVSPLRNLTNLISLYLDFNNISDVSPLRNLTKLTSLDLGGNVLSTSSINDHIPVLRRRGAIVAFDLPFRESDFDIELVFLADFTEKQKKLIQYAARRWMSIIREDLPDYTFTGGFSGLCGDHSYRIPAGERIDDLRIYITIFDDYLDAPSGWGGPDVLRETSRLSVVGCMGFNLVDIDYSYGTALHEIGHVLGVGTLWYDFGFLQNPSWNNPNADTHFNGPLAIAAFNRAGGRNYAGAKVPVYRGEKRRSVDSHWRDSVLVDELMTTTGGSNLLSAITLQSLADLGYSVDVTQANPYTLSDAVAKASAKIAAPSTHAGREWSCGTGEQREPIYVVDEQGNIIRTLHR